MYRVYKTLSFLAAPFVPFLLHWRRSRGKEEPGRQMERLGIASIPRPPGLLLWFHAASMGEGISILPLLGRIASMYPEARILLTTVTVTSAKNVAPKLPAQGFHQFAPIDTPRAVERFLAHWKPDMAFWVESEFWPNMMLATHRKGCRMFLINARISQRSAEKWYKAQRFIRTLLGTFEFILAKSDEDATRLKNLGALRVESRGNLKFAAPPLDADAGDVQRLATMIGERPCWLASSTHMGEETMAAEAHQKLKEAFHTLLTIIVPRHHQRGAEIVRELRQLGLKVAQRSVGDTIVSDTDIYIADTMGELGIFYRVCPIVFMGGSLVPHGGQNPFEPARLNCAVLYGPYMENFTEFCHELESSEGAVRVRHGDELRVRVEDLLRDPARQEKMAKQAFKAVQSKEKVLDAVFEAIAPYIEALPKMHKGAFRDA